MAQEEIFHAAWASLASSLEELALEIDRAKEIIDEENETIPSYFEIVDGTLIDRDDDSDDEPTSDEEGGCSLLSDSIAELAECVHERNRERVSELFGAFEVDWSTFASRDTGLVVGSIWDPRRDYIPRTDPLNSVWAEIKSALEILTISDPVLIYESHPQIVIPSLVVSVQQALIEKIERDPRHLFAVSSRQFEEIIAEIFESRGFSIELTQETRDWGRDIIAIGGSLGIRHKYLIECKRYAPQRKVSIAAVQRLYGVKMAERANKAILATTSGFSSPAVEFARQNIWDIDLRGYDDIMTWIRSYKR